MAPQTGTAVLVLAAFVLPGFVTALIRDRTYHVRSRAEPGELLLAALYYSALIYIIAAALGVVAGVFTDFGADDVAGLYRGDGTLAEYTGLALLGLVIGPCLVAVSGKVWIDSRLRARTLGRLDIDPAHRTRSGWEHWFAQRRPCMIRVTLADGRVVGGFMGTESFAGFTVHTQDLFIEQRWELDDDEWFLRPADDSLGVYLRGDQINSFEVYAYPTGEPGTDGANSTDAGSASRLAGTLLVWLLARDLLRSHRRGSSRAATRPPDTRPAPRDRPESPPTPVRPRHRPDAPPDDRPVEAPGGL